VTLAEDAWLAGLFDDQRTRLLAVAYRMLGSLSEAEDAVQGTWLRLSRSDVDAIDNLGGWLTTAVARECLDMLRSRRSRREEPFGVHVPDPIVSPEEGPDPEQETLLAESVGLALLVVLDTMSPAERVAFVLHDVFSVPFDEIASVLGRSPAATRQLASRGRRKVKGSASAPDTDLDGQRKIVGAFLAAARHGDFESLLSVLHPDVVARADFGALPNPFSGEIQGRDAVAEQAAFFARRLGQFARPAMINGTAGVVAIQRGEPRAILAFTIRVGQIVEIDVLADPKRLRKLNLSALTG
jgi:RNA polymerase sigma factor (sigma-70 family)